MPLDRRRSGRVQAAISSRAQSEGVPVTVAHVCVACTQALNMSGAGLLLVTSMGLGEPVYATDPRTDRLAELQITLGAGPAHEALCQDRPVLVPDLAATGTQRRWPIFAPGAHDLGVRAVFAFPLLVGAIAVGVLEVNRQLPGWLSPDQLADALLYADAALLVTLRLTLDKTGDAPAGTGQASDGYAGRWAEVHQATGMVAVQLSVGLSEAFVRLRAYAYTNDRRLAEVARDIVARRLRLEPD
ncbi:GAF and ANTAR domain-containing protein [Nonomuraea sp. NPDC026600]|uniref:GAF and ANTAR domain-containing protein n=1 Tax=Nonomuraea sp. NPDC026600 TaxID=3155363 RepID=UPI0033C150D8